MHARVWDKFYVRETNTSEMPGHTAKDLPSQEPAPTDTADDVARFPSAHKGKTLEGRISPAKRKEKFLDYQTANVQGPPSQKRLAYFYRQCPWQ